MRPTWLERKRLDFLGHGVIQLLIHTMIGVTGALTGHPDDRWRLYFMLVWSSLCAVAVGLGLVGYRRRALRMRFVVMDLAVNEDQDPWQLLRDGTISFKEFEKIHARQIARRFLGTP